MGEARLLLRRTDLSVPGPTPLAPTAAADERDRHRIADPPSADLLTDLGHHPGKLMTRHVREDDLLVARPRVPVAAAHTCGHDPDHDPAERGRGLGYLPNLGLGSNGIQDDGAHRYSVSAWSLHVSKWDLGFVTLAITEGRACCCSRRAARARSQDHEGGAEPCRSSWSTSSPRSTASRRRTAGQAFGEWAALSTSPGSSGTPPARTPP